MMMFKRYLLIGICLSAAACGGGSDGASPQPSSADEDPECAAADQPATITSGGSWQLVWSDEFDGPDIDLSKWDHEVNCAGGGNNELQCYVDSAANSYIQSGALHIRAQNETVSGDAGWNGDSGVIVTRDYTSARMRTLNQGDWRYGRLEIRARLPYGQGLWPAIWMLPTDNRYGGWPFSGEIDIMEAINLRAGGFNNNRIYGTLHYTDTAGNLDSSGTSRVPATDLVDNFHTFALEWEAGEIRWYLDNLHYATQRQTGWLTCGGPKAGVSKTSAAPFDRRFHLLLNVAVGGNWPGNPDGSTSWPQEMIVDYVRVYECASDPVSGHGCSTVDPMAELVE